MLNSPARFERVENLLRQGSAVSKPQQRQPMPMAAPHFRSGQKLMNRSLPPAPVASTKFLRYQSETVPPAKAHPAPCRTYHLLSIIYPGTQYNKMPQAAHFCRIRFLHNGFGASLNEPNPKRKRKIQYRQNAPPVCFTRSTSSQRQH